MNSEDLCGLAAERAARIAAEARVATLTAERDAAAGEYRALQATLAATTAALDAELAKTVEG